MFRAEELPDLIANLRVTRQLKNCLSSDITGVAKPAHHTGQHESKQFRGACPLGQLIIVRVQTRMTVTRDPLLDSPTDKFQNGAKGPDLVQKASYI